MSLESFDARSVLPIAQIVFRLVYAALAEMDSIGFDESLVGYLQQTQDCEVCSMHADNCAHTCVSVYMSGCLHAKQASDIMLVMDASGSIADADWALSKNFSLSLVSTMFGTRGSMHIGIVSFNDEAKLVTKLESNQDLITRRIDSSLATSTEGRTNTEKGVRLAAKDLADHGRPNIPKLLVLLTDGLPSNRTAADAAFAEAKAEGVAVQLVEIGLAVITIPSPPAWSAEGFPPIQIKSYHELPGIVGTVANTICKLSNPNSTSPSTATAPTTATSSNTATATTTATFSPNVPASILPGQPADPQCISCQDPSQFAKSRDYQGSDLIKGGLSASSPAECCKKCTGTKLCQ